MWAVAVTALWGVNFVVIKWSMVDFPPFLLASGRFAMCVLPWIFFIRRPAVSWASLVAFGACGAGQFGLLFFALRADVSPGLASLIMQSQAFFTIGLSMVLRGERMKQLQYVALGLVVAGIALIAWHAVSSGDGSITLIGLAMLLAGAMCWALGNTVVRHAGRIDALGFLVWSSLFAVPPLFLLSLGFEGWDLITRSARAATWVGWGGMLWQALANTLLGFGVWNWLLARYPAATVAPFSLLVPVFGMSASTLFLGESLPPWKLAAAVLVMAGLALNVRASRAGAP